MPGKQWYQHRNPGLKPTHVENPTPGAILAAGLCADFAAHREKHAEVQRSRHRGAPRCH